MDAMAMLAQAVQQSQQQVEREVDEFDLPAAEAAATPAYQSPVAGPQGPGAPMGPQGPQGPQGMPQQPQGMPQQPQVSQAMAPGPSMSGPFQSQEAQMLYDRSLQQSQNPIMDATKRFKLGREALDAEKAHRIDEDNKAVLKARQARMQNAQTIGTVFGLPKDDPRALQLSRLMEANAPKDLMEAAMIRMGLAPGEGEQLKAMADMPSEQRTKLGLLVGGTQLMNENLPRIFDENGSYDVSIFVPGTEGNRAMLGIRRAMINTLRAASGAAIPESEIEREVEQYVPQPGDKDEKARARIEAFTTDVNNRTGLFTEGFDVPEKYQTEITLPWSGGGRKQGKPDETGLRDKYGL